MFRKLTWLLLLLSLGAFAVACGSPAPAVEEAAISEETVVEPAAEVVAETAEEAAEEVVVAEEVEEEMAESEEMEEAHSDDSDAEMAESHDDDMAEEEMASEEMASEEMEAEEEMAAGESEEMTEMADGNSGVYAVSIADSSVRWEGSKPVGSPHFGTVNISEGTLELADGALVSGMIVLDMTSITNEDLGGNMASRLVGHLNSEDFFNTAAHPTAMIEITGAELVSENLYNVSGNLTIKDITQPIEFTAEAAEAEGTLSATADIIFDRTLFDITYNSGSFFSDLGDDLINDEVGIEVSLVAAQ
ncbi:MAG: YceI family protein [Chloroflexota bacterium]